MHTLFLTCYCQYNTVANSVNYYTTDEYFIRVIHASFMGSPSFRSMHALMNRQGLCAFNIQTSYVANYDYAVAHYTQQ